MSCDDTDDRLMEKAALGVTGAFDRIVYRHQDRVQRFATRMLGGDAAGGADIAVGTFLRLWEARAAFRPCGRLEAWLLRTASRLCLDALARIKDAEPLAEQMTETPGALPSDGLSEAVRQAVMELPETHRNVLILAAYEGMAYDEIAEILDISVGTVGSRKNHAIATLRRRLAAWRDI